MKKTKITKIGNSYGVVIPKEILAKANISDNIIITVEDNKIVISRDSEISLNKTVEDRFKELHIQVLPRNVISLQGLEIPLNTEQINLLNNQINKHG